MSCRALEQGHVLATFARKFVERASVELPQPARDFNPRGIAPDLRFATFGAAQPPFLGDDALEATRSACKVGFKLAASHTLTSGMDENGRIFG